MGEEPSFVCSNIQMCNCAYALTNLACTLAPGAHHLTHQKCDKYISSGVPHVYITWTDAVTFLMEVYHKEIAHQF